MAVRTTIEASRFTNEEHKVAYVIGFLTGDTYKAVSLLVDDQQVKTLAELLKHLDATYEDPDPTATAAVDLKKLRRAPGAEFVAHYTAFQWIMAIF